MKNKIYCCLKKNVENNILQEPFSKDDFKRVCPNFADNTYNVFLNKHRVGNPNGQTELFEKDDDTKTYRLVRPYKEYKC